MKRLLLLVAIGALTACSGRADDLERQFREAQATGVATEEELCARATAVSEAHLEAGNDEQYRDWNLLAKVTCQSAALQRYSGG